MLFFKAKGHKVISLSQREGVEINPFLKSQGIEAYSFVLPGELNFLYFLRHTLYLINFCWKNKITVVFSHLDSANFVASIGQYFIRANVFLCRHHIDEAALYNYHLSWSYKLANRLAKKVIVVSQRSLHYMVNVENVPERKLIHINLAYDFSLYRMPDTKVIKDIRGIYNAKTLLITVCRLTKFKRPELSIQVVRKLKAIGMDAHLIILGTGEMHGELQRQIEIDGLSGSVSLPGHVSNALDYMAAADFILHPSVLESSCVVIKEAGLVQKPVIVCKDIGDFNDYIVSGYTGFLVNKDAYAEQASHIIHTYANDQAKLLELGKNLESEVYRLFDIKNVSLNYKSIVDGN